MMTNFFTKKIALISFFLMIAIQMLCYNYIDYIQMEPRSVHSWRQADCLSFVLNFYNGRTTFTEPGVNNLGITGDGKIASDFPIVQYTVAQVWKLTGISTPIYRLVDLAFLIIGLFYIYKLYSYWFDGRYWLAILMTGLIYTSTILAYYGPTSISDIQAFGLSCMAFYYFMLWLDLKQNRYLVIALLVFSLAGLLKMSSAFIFSIALAYLMIRLLVGSKEERAGLLSVKSFFFIGLTFVPWVIWYTYVHRYNQLHPNDFFLIGILPIWENTMTDINYIISRLLGELLPYVFNIHVLFFLFLVSGTWFIIHFKSFFTETYLRMLIPVMVLLSYIVLFFKVFGVHDYYLINMMPVLIIVMGLLMRYLILYAPQLVNNRYARLGLIFLLIVLTFQTASTTRARIEFNDWGYPPLVFRAEKYDYYKWNTWHDRSRFEILENLEEVTLDSMGLDSSKKVICLGDHNINRSLYLINRLGYTSYNTNIDQAHEFIEYKKTIGLDYLILIEPDWLNKENLQPFFKNKVYEKGGTSIYKL